MLLHTLIKERLDSEKGTKTKDLRAKILEQLFEMFPANDLVDSEFHQYLF